MKLIFTLLILLITVASVHANPVILDCNTKQKIVIAKIWETTYLNDYKNATDESFIIVIKDAEISLNDGSLFKEIPDKHKTVNGYTEYGYLSKNEFFYEGSRKYEMGENGDENYILSKKTIRLHRLSGDFSYSKIFNLDDIRTSEYQKFNYNNLTSGFVIQKFTGTCKASKQKQLF